MDKYAMLDTWSPEEIAERASAIVGENNALRCEIDQLRGRLRESRRATVYYHRQYEKAMRYRTDAEAERRNFREIVLAVVGLTVAGTLAAVVAAIVWGWWHG